MSLPAQVQKMFNARADDAIRELHDAIRDGDRGRLHAAAWLLIECLEDEMAATQEWAA